MWELYNKLTGLRRGFGWCEFDTRKEAKQAAAQINEIAGINVIGTRNKHKAPDDEIYFVRIGMDKYLGFNDDGGIWFYSDINDAYLYPNKGEAVDDICKLHPDDLEQVFIVKYEMK